MGLNLINLGNLGNFLFDGGVLAALIMSIFEVSKIPLNPWSWLAKKIGHAINGEVIEKVDQLGEDVKTLREECDERDATLCRARILRFGDEILHEVRHSKEHFDQILSDITTYEQYCGNHPCFRNNIAAATIDRIRQVYRDRLAKNDFL